MTQAAVSLQLGLSGGLTDRSGAATSTDQVVANVNLQRSYLFIQNPKTNASSLFVNFTNAASATAVGSIELASGASLEQKFPGFVTTEAVHVIVAGANQNFVYKEA